MIQFISNRNKESVLPLVGGKRHAPPIRGKDGLLTMNQISIDALRKQC